MADQRLTLAQAYLAMYYFVKAYWERGKCQEGSVTLLVNALDPTPDPSNPQALATNDPAFWDDWQEAIQKARAQGLPE